MVKLRYRQVKKVYRVVKTGRVTPGTFQYLGRQYEKANVHKNYANPVARRKDG